MNPSFFHCPYVDLQQKVWPRLKVFFKIWINGAFWPGLKASVIPRQDLEPKFVTSNIKVWVTAVPSIFGLQFIPDIVQ